MEEIWKDIEGYEGLYQVSNLGRIKSLYYHNGTNERILKPNVLKQSGYEQVILVKNKEKKPFLVHRLVAVAFVPNPNNYLYVGHKDETRWNHKASNLEWVTQKENNNMPLHIQRIKEKCIGRLRPDMVGILNHKSKQVICEGIIFGSISECARYYENVKPRTMDSWLLGKRKMPQIWVDRGLKFYNE